MSYSMNVMNDNPIGYWPLDETSGTIAYDSSGCGNNGSYPANNVFSKILPMCPGGLYSTLINTVNYLTLPITKNYIGSTEKGGLATKYYSDNDFSIEILFKSYISTSSATPIFADNTNKIGIYWENGSILFSLQDAKLYCTPKNIKKSMHLVVTYSQQVICIYVDGTLLASKILDSFVFTNTSLSFSSGPSLNASDSFLIDAPAVYRYALSQESILSHFNSLNTISPIQVVSPDGGTLFMPDINDLKEVFEYGYPKNKNLYDFINSSLQYNQVEKSLQMAQESVGQSKDIEIYDYIVIPLTHLNQMPVLSKVEWSGENGIFVYTSLDNINWSQCTNGKEIPQYNSISLDLSGVLYIKIVFSSFDTSKFLPKLEYFNLSIYNGSSLPSYNFGDKISKINQVYSVGTKVYNILSHNYYNGLRTQASSGFKIENSKSIRSIEFFYTPTSNGASQLISNASAGLSWNTGGTVSKNNIASVYINGIDRSSITTASTLFSNLNQIHYIVINFASPISGDISIGAGPEALYSNIALYEYPLTQAYVSTHYNLYTSFPSSLADPEVLSISESGTKVFNNTWEIIQSR
jgi:hypothetical protein